jgi:hypothetical protein
MACTFAASFLPFSLFMVFLRDRYLALAKLPSREWSGPRQVEFLTSQPLRVRVTIGRSMIAVAIVAVVLGVATGLVRQRSATDFLNRASLHATHERAARVREFSATQSAILMERRGHDARVDWQVAARAKANAEYRAAMRDKYETAASRHWFFVEPDPPEPRMP